MHLRSPERLHTTSVDLMDAADNWKPPYLCILRATRMDKRWRGKNMRREGSVCVLREWSIWEGDRGCTDPRFIPRGKLKRHNFRGHAYTLFREKNKSRRYLYPLKLIHWKKYSIHVWKNHCGNKNIFFIRSREFFSTLRAFIWILVPLYIAMSDTVSFHC